MAVESVEIVLNGVDNASPVVDKVTQKLVSSEEKYISKLKEQLIALQEGTAAAEKFKLAEMGFSEATIEAAVALKQEIEAAKEMQRAANQLEKDLQKAAEAQQELQQGQGPGLAESASEWADALQVGLGRAKQIAEASKPIVDFLTNSVGWQMKMNGLMEKHQQQVDFNLKKKQEDFDVQIQIANLQTSEVERQQMLKQMREGVTTELQAQEQLVSQMQQTVQESENSFAGRINRLAENVTGGLYNNNEDQQIVENILLEEEKRLEALRKQKEQLDQQLETENEQLRLARERFELEQQRQQAAQTAEEHLNKLRAEIREMDNPGENERRRVEEMFNADGVSQAQRQELETLEAIRKEKEEQARIEQEAREKAKQAELDLAASEKARMTESNRQWEELNRNMDARARANESYLENLRLQNIELTQGKKAAEEYKAAQAGVSQEVIEQGRQLSIQNELLAAQKQLADEEKKKEEDLQKKLGGPTPQLQAMQSRLLTRSGVNPNDRAVKASEKTVELTAKIEQLQRELLAEQRKQKGGIIEIISRP